MDNVTAGFCQSLTTLNKIGECSVCFQVGSLIYDSRNELVKRALELGADRILWFDSDVIFNPDAFEKLEATLEEQNADVVTGLIMRRVAPYTPILFSELSYDDEEGKGHWKGYNNYPMNSVFDVDGFGFGCVLMKTDFLADMALDYGTWFGCFGGMGEDLSFCIRAKELGKKLVCDSRVKCGHIGHVIITEQFYQQCRGDQDENKDVS